VFFIELDKSKVCGCGEVNKSTSTRFIFVEIRNNCVRAGSADHYAPIFADHVKPEKFDQLAPDKNDSSK
jgi:hypothetical protein